MEGAGKGTSGGVFHAVWGQGVQKAPWGPNDLFYNLLDEDK